MNGSAKPSDPVGRPSAKSVMASLMVETTMTEMMSEAMKPAASPMAAVTRPSRIVNPSTGLWRAGHGPVG